MSDVFSLDSPRRVVSIMACKEDEKKLGLASKAIERTEIVHANHAKAFFLSPCAFSLEERKLSCILFHYGQKETKYALAGFKAMNE